jgi:uncharacterized protein YebE (UPF0316 family)
MEFLAINPWLFAPAIFLARVIDVSMGTFRTIVVFRGFPARAAVIGFVEILIWVAASSQVLRQVNAWPLMVAYAGGFAAGNYLGVWLESKVAMGQELFRIIATGADGKLAKRLSENGQPVVSLNCRINGRDAEVLLVTTDRRNSPALLAKVRESDPDALYTISDIKTLPASGPIVPRRWPLVPSGWRVRGKQK